MTNPDLGVGGVEERVALLNARLDRLPVFGLSRWVFVVVGAAYFFTFYDITAIGVTLPVLEQQFGLSGTELALPVTTNLFAYIVGAYVLSSVADYIGRRRALAFSVLLLFVGGILTALSWNLETLAIFRAVTGLGMGAEILARGDDHDRAVPSEDAGPRGRSQRVLGRGRAGRGPLDRPRAHQLVAGHHRLAGRVRHRRLGNRPALVPERPVGARVAAVAGAARSRRPGGGADAADGEPRAGHGP